MSKYKSLEAILDGLCEEARIAFPKLFDCSTPKQRESARSRSYIHLLLKVRFGLLDVILREHVVTEGGNDGGIDAYYIDHNDHIVYLIQAKYRPNNRNYESKEILYDELLSMDIDRILHGDECDARGIKYRGKIRQMQREISEIEDITQYAFKVILLANVSSIDDVKIHRLIGDYAYEVYDAQRVYDELVFPVVSGTFYKQEHLTIVLAVSPDSKDNRIEYPSDTANGKCIVNIMFVPTKEIGKILYQYKNTILQYNPRSYLGLESNPINENIKRTIESTTTNEFALLNNGITILADKANYSDRIGKANVAKLSLINPQIINGGQTAYTLSKIYERALVKGDMSVFDSKEVLLRVIAFDNTNQGVGDDKEKKLLLIEEISNATNQQTEVTESDRRANSPVLIDLQRLIFKDFGFYFERKQGEYDDGLAHKYISEDLIINKESFLRCCIAVSGNPSKARQKSTKVIFRKAEFDRYLPNALDYRRLMFAYKTFAKLSNPKLNECGIRLYARYAIVYVVSLQYRNDIATNMYDAEIDTILANVLGRWAEFEKYALSLEANKNRYFIMIKDEKTKEVLVDANWQGYYKGMTLNNDLYDFFVTNNSLQA